MAETTEEIIIKVEAEGAKKTTEELEDLAGSLKTADKETKKYTKTLGDSAKEVQIFGTSLGGLKGGFTSAIAQIKNTVKGLNAFKVAVAATGIGLIVIALGAMAVAISKSESAMDKLTDALDVVKTVIEVAIGVVGQLGQALIKLVNLDFAGAMDTASAAVDNLSGRMKENIDLTLSLNQANRDLEKQLTSNLVTIAQNNAEIAKQKRLSDDITKSIEIRIAAAEKAAILIRENAALETATAKEALRIRQEAIESDNETNGQALKTREQEAELAELKILEIQAIQREEELLTEIVNKGNQLRLEQSKAIQLQQSSIYQLDINNNKKAEQKKTLDIAAEAKKRGTIAIKSAADTNKTYDASVVAFQEGEDAKLEAGRQLATAFSSINSLLGFEGKAGAIVDSLINTAVGVSRVLGRPALMAATAAAGLALTAKIASQQPPEPKQYGRGGLLSGPSHEGGGIMINAEGGETVINKRSSLMFRDQLSAINQAGGGIPFMRLGGVVPNGAPTQSPFVDLENAIRTSQPVLVTEDLHSVQRSLVISEALTTL